MSLTHDYPKVYPNRPQLRLVEPPNVTFCDPAQISTSGISMRNRRELAYTTGRSDGREGKPDRRYYNSLELRLNYERGYQHGWQDRAGRAGEELALVGADRVRPDSIPATYEPEFFAGWDRGQLLFSGQVHDLAEADARLRWLHS